MRYLLYIIKVDRYMVNLVLYVSNNRSRTTVMKAYLKNNKNDKIV